MEIGNFLRRLGSLLPRGAVRASTARVVRPWFDDAQRTHPTIGLTPARMLSFLHAADAGQPGQQFEVFAEMLTKWPRLAAVESTRRLALTGLAWGIRGAGDAGGGTDGAGVADAVAEYCRESLTAIERFPEVLDHLANAIGHGIAVAELVWDRGRLIDIVPVPYSRLVADANEPWRLRVRIEESPAQGVALDERPFKWIVHRPRSMAGRQFDGGLLRTSALLFLAQNLSFKDWLIFSQIAGMPLRVAQFDPGVPDSEKQGLVRALQQLSTDAVAAFGKNVDLKLVEARGGDKPYLPLQEYCNTEVTILWLGQHLTTDIRQGGSRAAAEVHDRVREDLLVSDMAAEAQTLRRDLLRPLVMARFGAGAAVPRFERSLLESQDTQSLAQTLAVAVEQLGLRVPTAWAHRALGIPEAAAGEATLTHSINRQ